MPPATRYTFLFLVLTVGFIFRLEFFLRGESQETLPRYLNTTVLVVGTVAEDPDVRERTVRVTVKATTINGEQGSGILVAVLPGGTQLRYGDRVEVRGLLQAPEAFETEAGRLFDYPGYLRVRGVSALMPYATLRSTEDGPWSVRRTLFELKEKLEASLSRALPEPQAALLRGILLGERGGFPPELMALFVLVGLVHVVVLSGSNISIVSEGVFRILSFLPRTAVFVVGSIVMILFVLMTGGAAGVRALLMGLIAVVARYLRRPAAALRMLAAAGVAMVLWSPVVLLDSGFVLSMLATFGLITLSPAVEGTLRFLPAWKRFNVRSIVASTIAVELFILPALLYFSGVFSLVSLPVNALVLPIMWLVMLLGFVTGFVGLLHPLLALLPAFLTDILLRYVLLVAHGAAALPWSHTFVPAFDLWVAVLVYVPLTFVAIWLYQAQAKQA